MVIWLQAIVYRLLQGIEHETTTGTLRNAGWLVMNDPITSHNWCCPINKHHKSITTLHHDRRWTMIKTRGYKWGIPLSTHQIGAVEQDSQSYHLPRKKTRGKLLGPVRIAMFFFLLLGESPKRFKTVEEYHWKSCRSRIIFSSWSLAAQGFWILGFGRRAWRQRDGRLMSKSSRHVNQIFSDLEDVYHIDYEVLFQWISINYHVNYHVN